MLSVLAFVKSHDISCSLFMLSLLLLLMLFVVCPDIETPFVSAVKEDASRDLDQGWWTGWI